MKNLTLDSLSQQSRDQIRGLGEVTYDLWLGSELRRVHRAERYRIDALIEEFQAPFREGAPRVSYDFAFVCEWFQSEPKLYEARHWICGHSAGVYFIYDGDEVLKYVGASCGGDMGNRIYRKAHEEYRRIVDVVLFDGPWCHLALAFEALAVSRLYRQLSANPVFQTLVNRNLTRVWIPPPPPFDRIWKRPE